MILTAHQPVYLPWLGLFHKISLADSYVHYDHVQHASQDYTARNFIRSPQGKHRLTVPIQNARSNSILLKDLKIDNTAPWRRNHWKSIQLNYSKASHFKTYAPIFERFYTREWSFVSEMNLELLNIFLLILGINVPIALSSELDIESKKNSAIIEMCKKLKADHIILGVLGKDYVDKQLFQNHGIGISFQDYNHPEYHQRFEPFISHLSTLDLIFNHGPDALKILTEGNILKSDIGPT
jgi:hypothetical protein